MFKIELAAKKDLPQCAQILMDIYNNNVLNEGWTKQTAETTCNFYYRLNKDLFFVAKNENGEVVGFTYSFIKPWSNGNQLMIEEISVSENYRKQGIATALLTTLIQTAKKKYNITMVNGSTYLGENKMPFAWYQKIGFKKLDELFLIEGDANVVLNKLKK